MNLYLPSKQYLVNKWIQLFCCTCFFLLEGNLFAQCPPNIDFENGTFSGWKLWAGSVSTDPITDDNLITLAQTSPIAGRHQILSSNPGDGLDEFGGFPRNCPNGSAHSIQLGNRSTGNQAEGASYEFTIPATANQFSLIYYYAVVIQDPGHLPAQQPRLEIEVTNVTDNTPVGCSSFTFIASGGLPGFQLSPRVINNSPIWYKPWSANSINLDGKAGKTIRIFFKTADCTYVSHFGYAYIDVSTECYSSFFGASYCPADTAVNIAAPYGYNSYTWYNSSFSQVLGNSQVLHLSPPPPSGTNVFVKLTPFSGYGCIDTLKASLFDTLQVVADAGPDKTSCNKLPVQIGVAPVNGLAYKWTPADGLSDPSISNPTARALATTQYVLNVSTLSGGCSQTDTVIVKADALDSAIEVLGPQSFCSASGQNTVLKVHATDSIQWYKDNIAIAGAVQSQFTVMQTGIYKAMLFSNGGCVLPTQEKNITVFPSPVADFSLDNGIQCLLNNQFNFTNLSSPPLPLQYNWELGNGTILNARDISYGYPQPGQYNVKLTVKTSDGCSAVKPIAVTVLPSAIADFSIKPTCIGLDLPVINKTNYSGTSTIDYLWDFGNGATSTQKNPVYQFSAPGTYHVTLTTSTPECPQPSVKPLDLLIDSPVPGATYPVQQAIFNYPLKISARQIGREVLWTPATNLNSPNIFDPTFKGLTEQLYNIRITTESGCVTNDKQLVKTIKKIEIHVPNTFTPDGDGINDFLRPLLYGFKKLNYFRVYNRWGKILFQTQAEQPGWDGTVKNIPQEMQTVIWTIEAEDVDGNIHHDKGSTLLWR